MTKLERDIRSKRNEIKYQDVQENLRASALIFIVIFKN